MTTQDNNPSAQDEKVAANAAFEMHCLDHSVVLGMPGLAAKPSFMYGFKAGAQWQASQPCKQCDAKQAKIDTLMLEYCPDEMTKEQVDTWGASQRAVIEEFTIPHITSRGDKFVLASDASHAVAELVAGAAPAQTAVAVPDGWQLVPKEPDESMIQAMCLSQSSEKFASYDEWWNSHSSGVSKRIRKLLVQDYVSALAAAPAAPIAVQDSAVWDAGIELVAKLIANKIEAYDNEHGRTDPDTGTREYPGNGIEWVHEMDEMVEEIRALKSTIPSDTHDDAARELDRLRRMASCGTVDSFMSLPDADKRYWFAMCLDESERRKLAEARLAFLHSANLDADGYEFGVARVKFSESGQVESLLWGLSDHSDLDAAMAYHESKQPAATYPLMDEKSMRVKAMLDRVAEAPTPTAPDIEQLLKFYNASNLEQLVRAQAGHIAKMQEKLPPVPPLSPTFPRG